MSACSTPAPSGHRNDGSRIAAFAARSQIGPFSETFAAVGDISRDCLSKPRLLRRSPAFDRAGNRRNTTRAVSVTKMCGPALEAPITTMPEKAIHLFIWLENSVARSPLARYPPNEQHRMWRAQLQRRPEQEHQIAYHLPSRSSVPSMKLEPLRSQRRSHALVQTLCRGMRCKLPAFSVAMSSTRQERSLCKQAAGLRSNTNRMSRAGASGR